MDQLTTRVILPLPTTGLSTLSDPGRQAGRPDPARARAGPTGRTDAGRVVEWYGRREEEEEGGAGRGAGGGGLRECNDVLVRRRTRAHARTPHAARARPPHARTTPARLISAHS